MILLLLLLVAILPTKVELITNDTCEISQVFNVYKQLLTRSNLNDKSEVCCISTKPNSDISTKHSSIGFLLQEISHLPAESRRKISSVLGAVVADAASVPLQWIYEGADSSGILGNISPTLYPSRKWKISKEGVEGEGSPAFYPTSHSPIFSIPTGGSSCYGDGIKTCLRVLAENGGQLDVEKIQDGVRSFFGSPDSPYQIAMAKRPQFFAALLPVPGTWLNGCVIRSLINMDSGVKPSGDKTCGDGDGFSLSLPAFLLNYRPAEAEKTAKIVTNTPLTITHLKVQTRILNNFIKNIPNPVEEAKRWCRFEAKFNDQFHQIVREITDVEEALGSGMTAVEVVDRFGKSCGFPMSFQGSLSVLLSPAPLDRLFSQAVESNIIAGGDCCGRASFIGACLGAKLGVQRIPVEWLEKVEGIEELIQDAIKVYK